MLARTPVSACITTGVPHFDIESVERVNLSVDGVSIGMGLKAHRKILANGGRLILPASAMGLSDYESVASTV
jgi:hypothetical protein